MAALSNLGAESTPEYSFKLPRRQYFSLPFNLITYLMDACTTPEVYEKLQKSCKHFFSKRKILLFSPRVRTDGISYFWYSYESEGDFERTLELTTFGFRFWLTNNLILDRGASFPLQQHIYHCNLSVLAVVSEELSYKEISFLLNGGKIQDLVLPKVQIKHDDGTPVTLDQILAQCPRIYNLLYFNPCETFSTNTFKKLTELGGRFKFISFNIVISSCSDLIDPLYFRRYLRRKMYKFDLFKVTFKCDYPQTDIDHLESIAQSMSSDKYKKYKKYVQLDLS